MTWKRKKSYLYGEKGQIILIVVLVMVMALTIGLSVASRGIVGLRTSTEEADSQRALAAAEAGIERSLQEIQPVPLATTPVFDSEDLTAVNSRYSTTAPAVVGERYLVNGGLEVSKDEGADVWFVPHTATGDPDYAVPYPTSTTPQFMNLYWGNSSDGCKEAAIQVIVVTRDQSAPFTARTYRYAYDACPSRQGSNHFTLADPGSFTNIVTGSTFTYRTPLNSLMNGILPVNAKNIVFMRVIPIYKNAVIAVSACNHAPGSCTQLPIQGYQITSTGTSGDASRSISVFKGWSQTYLPYLSYGLFVAKDK